MDRIERIPYFKIKNDKEIALFARLFLRAKDNFLSCAKNVSSLQAQSEHWMSQGDQNALEKYKPILDEWNTLKPQERKAYNILVKTLTTVLHHCKEDPCIYIYFAETYNDRYYRDIYSLYYSKTHHLIPGLCSRFFLFDGGLMEQQAASGGDISRAFIGTIVRRPLKGREIGRTLIDPCYFFEVDDYGNLKCNIWRNDYKITMFGVPLSVRAFPYTMQDGEISTCSEVTIQNMIDYYSHRYSDYRSVFPSEISSIVQKNSSILNLPSRGLSYEMISKVFLELGFSPILYKAEKIKYRFADMLHSYVDSGIPVALGIDNAQDSDTSGHSVIVIGTTSRLIDADSDGRKEDFEKSPILRLPNKKRDVTYYLMLKSISDDSYIIMDDGRMPYSCAKIYEKEGMVHLQYIDDAEEDWVVSIFAVPMGKDMSVDVYFANNCFRLILTSELFSYSNYIERIKQKNLLTTEEAGYFSAGLELDSPLMTRVFLCPSRRFKEQRIMDYLSNGDVEAISKLQSVHFPRFIWVCELYTHNSYTETNPRCVGEIVLDATRKESPAEEDLSDIIWINYPLKFAYRLYNEDFEMLQKRMVEMVNTNRDALKCTVSPFRFIPHK